MEAFYKNDIQDLINDIKNIKSDKCDKSLIIQKLESLKSREVLPLFYNDMDREFPDYIVNDCHAGIVYTESNSTFDHCEAGHIGYETMGARGTFSIGMPMYSQDGKFLGRLGVGFYDSLDYGKQDKTGRNIPVYFWKIIGYRGETNQRPLTYYQYCKKIENDEINRNND